ncbi:pyrrolidone-carboxylate peptidase [bacterium MnTg02]|nr:pyrrolidone-carboxylate peptidase [bacterium MnTg02]
MYDCVRNRQKGSKSVTQIRFGPEPLRVLVTGFGPFPGAACNPSAWLAEHLQANPCKQLSDIALTSHVLETSWHYVDRYFEPLIEAVMPHVAIHFGLDQSGSQFRIETRARNNAARSADCNGAHFKRSNIVAGAPHILSTTLPHWPLIDRLRKQQLPAHASQDAGHYLCNYLYYLSLWNSRRAESPRLTCFVHIPPMPEIQTYHSRHCKSRGNMLSPAELVRGTHEIISYAVNVYRQRPSSREPHAPPPGGRSLMAVTSGATDGDG